MRPDLDSPASLRGLGVMALWIIAGLFSGFAYYGVLCLFRRLLAYLGVAFV